MDRVGRGLWNNFRWCGKDLTNSFFKPFLDKSWDPHLCIVDVTLVEVLGLGDHGVKGFLHVIQGNFHCVEGFFLFGEKAVTAIGGVKHA